MTTTSEPVPHYDNFIEDIINQGKRVSIYLVNGIKLQGIIVHYDTNDNSLILSSGTSSGTIQKVYRHATSTIVAIE